MYVSSYRNGSFDPVRRFTLPDYGADSDFKSGGESVVSASPDGNTLYILRGGRLYEATLNDSAKKQHLLPGNINFSDLQTHAFVSPDGRTLFFTSVSDKGLGGMDIYKSEKGEDGKWQDPQLLPSSINSGYNEDAPFMTQDGTLFFSSNGLPGYGGYDVYKTRMVNGEWTTPENLGQPVNTPGDDMYFALNPSSSRGFYSSNRQGGMGDMDIYFVHYVSTELPECGAADSLLVITATPDPGNSMSYKFSLQLHGQYAGKVRTMNLNVNSQEFDMTSGSAAYTFPEASIYKVRAKAVVYCDTCPALMALCAEKSITVGGNEFVRSDSTFIETPRSVGRERGRRQDKALQTDRVPGSVAAVKTELTSAQLRSIGWNATPAYFEYDASGLEASARQLLDQNITVLKSNKDLVVIVNGYADCRGNDAYNESLSLRRANSVKNYLIQKGISGYRITAIHAYGESRIENGCTDDAACDEEQHQSNRKVDFNVLGNTKMFTVSQRINQPMY